MDTGQTKNANNENTNTPEPTNTPTTSEEQNTPEVAPAATAVVTDAKADKTMNVLIAIVAVLVFMAGVQVFQTQQLYAAVSTGAVTGGGQSTQQSGGSALPSQVGGCG